MRTPTTTDQTTDPDAPAGGSSDTHPADADARPVVTCARRRQGHRGRHAGTEFCLSPVVVEDSTTTTGGTQDGEPGSGRSARRTPRTGNRPSPHRTDPNKATAPTPAPTTPPTDTATPPTPTDGGRSRPVRHVRVEDRLWDPFCARAASEGRSAAEVTRELYKAWLRGDIEA